MPDTAAPTMPGGAPDRAGSTRDDSPRLAHTMLRVTDLDRSLRFYVGTLGMTLQRLEDYPDGGFTLAFVGYGAGRRGQAMIELTHNWDGRGYEHGTRFGHVAIAVPDVARACAAFALGGAEVVRPPGPMQGGTEMLAFLRDPDGYQVEIVEDAR